MVFLNQKNIISITIGRGKDPLLLPYTYTHEIWTDDFKSVGEKKICFVTTMLL